MVVFAIIAIIIWAVWESHTTSREYIEKKHPEYAAQRAQRKALCERINKDHIKTVRSMGYEISDDHEVFHYSDGENM